MPNSSFSLLARRAAALRRFYGFLHDEGLRADDPSPALPRPTLERPLPKILDPHEVEAMFAAVEDRAASKRPLALRDLADELRRVLQDTQPGMSRREALRGLADRVDVPELRSFTTAVSQAEQYGVPIAEVLRVQAKEQRTKRSQRAEEQAMKLPVKLLFPTVVFIFPVMFIVLLGPAAIQISGVFG